MLRRVPCDLVDECRQEAWVAWREGRDPARVARNWLRRVRRQRLREPRFSQLGVEAAGVYAADTRGPTVQRLRFSTTRRRSSR